MVDDKELWAGASTDAMGFGMGDGILSNVHPASKCAGQACTLHNPSDHHMKDWPMLWRDDRKIMERICPHGAGHPDPDEMAYQATLPDGDSGVHGCHFAEGENRLCCEPPPQ